MNPHSPAQKLLAAIEVATTARQFACALADYRAPRNEKGRRIPQKGMPSLDDLQCHELPARSQISEWENGDIKSKFKNLDEEQLCAYLDKCHIAGELFEACIRHYRRITQQGTIGHTTSASIEPGQPHLAVKMPASSPHLVDEIYAELAYFLYYKDPLYKVDPLKVGRVPRLGDGELLIFAGIAMQAIESIGGEMGDALKVLLGAEDSPKSLAERERVVMEILELEPSLYYSDRHEHKLISKLANEMYKIYVKRNYRPGRRFSIYGDIIEIDPPSMDRPQPPREPLG